MMLSESRGDGSRVSGDDAPEMPSDTPAVRAISDTVSEDEDEELEKYLAYIHTVYSVFGFGLWTVCLKEDPDCIIGRCGLQPIADEDNPLGRIELGYLIDWKWRGCGYAFEACSSIVEYAFEKLGTEELYARVSPGNDPSCALLRRLGFERTTEDLWILRNEQADQSVE